MPTVSAFGQQICMWLMQILA